MRLQWAAKELAIANSVKHASRGISHVQPPRPPPVGLGIMKPIATLYYCCNNDLSHDPSDLQSMQPQPDCNH